MDDDNEEAAPVPDLIHSVSLTTYPPFRVLRQIAQYRWHQCDYD